MLTKQDKDGQLLKQAAKVLATNTNYATMVSTPMNNSNKIKFIQLSMVDEETGDRSHRTGRQCDQE